MIQQDVSKHVNEVKGHWSCMTYLKMIVFFDIHSEHHNNPLQKEEKFS